MTCKAGHILELTKSTYGTKASRDLEDSFALVLGVYSEYIGAC